MIHFRNLKKKNQFGFIFDVWFNFRNACITYGGGHSFISHSVHSMEIWHFSRRFFFAIEALRHKLYTIMRVVNPTILDCVSQSHEFILDLSCEQCWKDREPRLFTTNHRNGRNMCKINKQLKLIVSLMKSKRQLSNFMHMPHVNGWTLSPALEKN